MKLYDTARENKKTVVMGGVKTTSLKRLENLAINQTLPANVEKGSVFFVRRMEISRETERIF